LLSGTLKVAVGVKLSFISSDSLLSALGRGEEGHRGAKGRVKFISIAV